MIRKLLFRNPRRLLLIVLFLASSSYLYLSLTLKCLVQDEQTKARDLSELVSEPSEQKSGTPAFPAAHRRTAVVIVAPMRSGSTFVGELFNQHSDAFYVFEPFWAVENYANKTYSNALEMKVAFLKGISSCKFGDIRDIMRYYLTTKGMGVYKTCKTIDNMCARYRNQTKGKITVAQRCPVPPNLLPNVLRSTCESKQFTAIKTIRLDDVTHLQPLLQDRELDFKIIQLVRDPRGVISSRIALSRKNVSLLQSTLNTKVDREEVRELCDSMVRNAQPYKTEESWVRGRYALVRYEDVGLQPLDMMDKLYNFIGVKPQANISEWIKAHTKTAKRKRDRNDPFGTIKDPVQACNQWRLKLTLDEVKLIQSQCQEAMSMFGYKDVISAKQMSNKSVDLYDIRTSIVL
ncbi:PREDICTED: carbohydrate sulfotransferase 1-like [Branchiostoma belcheri]|uniref:Sulfotransferase n=1 Tax=Branchiostoma belcheri TaxID=7741 RepID=A0A6P4Y5H4_BRABE|nr:PREDICTED: carbohydrate sulfotransferase 1-like [Branchiostoma belcheri]XP_019613957.1 PREDICTED: carbohydrate sulfotransferase 1-like [Branchiostoma belcheri]XP_019613958.1 PREDICTED: carbohydrate sulfotransferase 1-like [Branchiostoma belcheri]